MDKLLVTSISTFLTISLSVMAVQRYFKYSDDKIKNKSIVNRMKYENIASVDFIEYGNYSSFYGGLFLFVLYCSVSIWVFIETFDIILTILTMLMFLYFGLVALYSILTPFLRKVEFIDEMLHYRDIVNCKYSLRRDQIKSVALISTQIVITTDEGKYTMCTGFQDPSKVYYKLMNWSNTPK